MEIQELFIFIYFLDILFIQKFTSPTKLELEQRKNLAFKNLLKMKRGFISYWLGIEVNKGLTSLLQIVQCPQLNKQVSIGQLEHNLFHYFSEKQ